MHAIKLVGWMPVVLLGACAQLGQAPVVKTDVVLKPASVCAALAGMVIPAVSIGLPTGGGLVSTATSVADTDPAGSPRSYCMVTGVINPVDVSAAPIRFQVNLPDGWNQRMLQFGGGGTNGKVVTGLGAFAGAPVKLPTPLARGYVTLGSDSGHNADKDPPFDTRFGLNQEQLLNFGQYQIKKTIDVAKYLVKTVYGQVPRYTYFAGGSQGGHESFDATQRYPADYDGVIAQYPAYNVVNMHMGSLAQVQAIYGAQSGKPSSAWMSPAKVALLVKTTAQACDALDGVEDGLISNVKACNAVFNIDTVKAQLRCAGGVDTGDACLSDAQIDAVQKISSKTSFNFAFSGGSTEYPHWPLLEGGTFFKNHLGKSNTAANPPVMPWVSANGSAFQLLPATGTIKGFITQDFSVDPLAFKPDAWVSRIQTLSGWLDASSTDLSRFAARGGKMLLTHGTIDDSITPHNTIAYWQRLVAAHGQSAVDTFARFYLIPGYGHGDGLFKASTDWLSALERWVEQGVAPQNLITMDDNTEAATASTNGRTRPLCRYPTWPRYSGPVNPGMAQRNSAANFTCSAG